MTTYPDLTIEGFTCHVFTFAVHPESRHLISLGLFGQLSHLEAISGCLSLGRRFDLPGIPAVVWPGRQVIPMMIFRQRLDPSGTGTLLWLPYHACFPFLRKQEPAYLLTRTGGDPTPPAFFEFLDHLTDIPLHPSWTPALWTWGLDAGWITPLLTHRLHAWLINPDDDALEDWISHGLRRGTLAVPEPTVPLVPRSSSRRLRHAPARPR